MMLLVPAPMEKRNAVSGAMRVICLGRFSMTFAATETIQSMPPAACIMAAEVTTARMIASAAAGGSPGGSRKTKTRTKTPRPPQRPTPTPPARVPMTIAPSTTSASSTKLTLMSNPSRERPGRTQAGVHWAASDWDSAAYAELTSFSDAVSSGATVVNAPLPAAASVCLRPSIAVAKPLALAQRFCAVRSVPQPATTRTAATAVAAASRRTHWVVMAGVRLRAPGSCQGPGLDLRELLGRDGSAVEERLGLVELVGGRGGGAAGDALDVLLLRSHLGLSGQHLALGHATAADDEVDEGGEEGDDEERQHPQHLREPTELLVPEEVSEDVEQHDEVGHEEEGPHKQPEEAPEVHGEPVLSLSRLVAVAVMGTASSSASRRRTNPASHSASEIARSGVRPVEVWPSDARLVHQLGRRDLQTHGRQRAQHRDQLLAVVHPDRQRRPGPVAVTPCGIGPDVALVHLAVHDHHGLHRHPPSPGRTSRHRQDADDRGSTASLHGE